MSIFFSASCTQRNPANDKMSGTDMETFTLKKSMEYVFERTWEVNDEYWFRYDCIFKYNDNIRDIDGKCISQNFTDEEIDLLVKFKELYIELLDRLQGLKQLYYDMRVLYHNPMFDTFYEVREAYRDVRYKISDFLRDEGIYK